MNARFINMCTLACALLIGCGDKDDTESLDQEEADADTAAVTGQLDIGEDAA